MISTMQQIKLECLDKFYFKTPLLNFRVVGNQQTY